MSKDKDEVLGHSHESDGIEEYDNPLPDWWLGLFVVCIIWAAVYSVDYHFVSDRSQEGYYEAELAAAAEQWPNLNKAATVSLDAATVAAGEAVFKGNCVTCHGADLHGGAGPNLTDDTWIHGGEPDQIAKTITEGVAAKAMPAWGPIIGPEKVGQVTAFIVSKKGQ